MSEEDKSFGIAHKDVGERQKFVIIVCVLPRRARTLSPQSHASSRVLAAKARAAVIPSPDSRTP
jgi:hypothetical protein